MRQGVVVLAVVVVMGIAACGGDDVVGNNAGGDNSAALLTLEQRVPGEAETPGWQPDPRETRRTATSLDDLEVILDHQLITATEEDTATLGEAGFISAILDTRFLPSEPGAEHVGDEPHTTTLVMQFNTEAGATDAVDLLHTDGLEPCPETCAFSVAEFEVDGMTNGRGIQRIATQEDLDRVGDTERHPEGDYLILFTDGPFSYALRLFGPPEEVSEEQAQEIAAKLYARVQGAPPPQG